MKEVMGIEQNYQQELDRFAERTQDYLQNFDAY